GRVTFPTGDPRFDRPLVVLGDLGAFLADLLPHTAATPKMASGSPARSSRGSFKKDRCSIRKPTAEPARAPTGRIGDESEALQTERETVHRPVLGLLRSLAT